MEFTIDDKEIENIIKECPWRNFEYDISVCEGMLSPCQAIIDSGKCDTLKEYFTKMNNGK